METESSLSYLDQCGVTIDSSKAATRLLQDPRSEKVGNLLERIKILEQKSHSQWAAEIDPDLEDRGLECFHHLLDRQPSFAPHTKRLDRYRGHSPFDTVFQDGCQTPANIASTTGRIGLEIVNDGLVCPVRFTTPAPEKEVPSQWKWTMFGNGQVRRIDTVVRIQIEYPATRHDQVAVFLNNHRVRFQTAPESLDQVEVESKDIGVGHTSV